MNREILFRGQTRRKGEKVRLDGSPVPSNWVYGGILPNSNGGDFAVIYQQEPEFEKFPVYADTVCQYIGFTDKNNKKAFEHDVVKVYLEDNVYEIGQIVWSNDGARFKFVSSETDGSSFGIDYTCKFEIIGNVFDDPELLDEGDEKNT